MWNLLSFNSNRIKNTTSSSSSTSTSRSRRYEEKDSVSQLRSLYATLLAAMEPPPPPLPLLFGAGNDNDHDDSIADARRGHWEKGYNSSTTVRNFRGETCNKWRSTLIKHKKKDQQDEMDDRNTNNDSKNNDNGDDDEEDNDHDDDECEISFETFHTNDDVNISNSTWRHLSATTTTTTTMTETEQVAAALVRARQIEARVVELIRSMGELVVYGEQRLNSTQHLQKKRYQHNQPQCRPPSLHDNGQEVFEYFCDKNILALLVDIVTAKPSPTTLERQYNGVVWTPLVKAQVLQTISIFISNVSDPTSLYYLLSNNYMNRIISSIVPLEQWSMGAQEEIVPVYISFLKSLALKLAKAPHLFQFFSYCDLDKNGHDGGGGGACGDDDDDDWNVFSKFPLFGAAVEVASSSLKVAKEDTFVHTTALNVILHLCQMPQEEVRSMIGGRCWEEQRMLICHLCDEIVLRYGNLVDLFMLSWRMGGRSCDNTQLHRMVEDEVARLDDVLHFVNDLLWCSQRIVNARFCEYFMQYVMVGTLLKNWKREKNKAVVVVDDDDDGKDQEEDKDEDNNMQHPEEPKVKFTAATLTLYRIFSIMDYVPLLKMISIALLHPYSPSLDHQVQSHGKDFVLTPALNSIAQNDHVVLRETCTGEQVHVSKESRTDAPQASNSSPYNGPTRHVDTTNHVIHYAVPNIYRNLIMEVISGALGERCFIMASLLLESMLQSKAMDSQLLKVLQMVPTVDDDKEIIHEWTVHSLDVPLTKFIDDLQNITPSTEGSFSMDCAVSLIILYLPHFIKALTEQESKSKNQDKLIEHLDIFTNIQLAKESFASESLRLKSVNGICDLFTVLVEEEIQKLFSVMDTTGPQIKFKCDLHTLSSGARKNIIDILITKTFPPTKTNNETNTARFVIRSLFILTSLHQNLSQVHTNLSDLLAASFSSLSNISSRWSQGLVHVDKTSVASKDVCTMGCLDQQSIVGTDVFIHDKTHFSISPSLALTSQHSEESGVPSISFQKHTNQQLYMMDSEKTKRRALADKILMKSSFSKTEMILVVTETELLIVKSKVKEENDDDDDTKVGTILCTTLLSNIIALAADDAWLHIAMRNVEDVGVLIRKGNMALRFKDKTTCYIAKKCIEESRDAYNRILSSTVDMLLRRQSDSGFS